MFSRRGILAATAVLTLAGGLTGCASSSTDVRLEARDPVTVEGGADEQLRRMAARTVGGLRADALSVQGQLGESAALSAALSSYDAALAGLGETQTAPPGAGNTGKPTSTQATNAGRPRPAPSAPGAPDTGNASSGEPTTGGGAAGLPELAKANARTAAELLGATSEAGGPLVRLVASVAAACLVHATAMGGQVRPPSARPPKTPSLADPGFEGWLDSTQGGTPPTGGGAQTTGAGGTRSAQTQPSAGVALPANSTDVTAAVSATRQRHYAAEYGYPLIAAVVTTPEKPLVRARHHRQSAHNLGVTAARAGVRLDPARAAYEIDRPADEKAAAALALGLELDCADAYSVVVARLSPDEATTRAFFVDAMVEHVVAAIGYGPVPALPGLAEHR
ncbi:MAG: hypothetical protein CSA58_05985 [Micrococcales bacterium]|nr:MAG: hypothetical protein CSA58_05985 [Micrococcales bacterium]